MAIYKIFSAIMLLMTGTFWITPGIAQASTVPNQKCPPSGITWSNSGQWTSRGFTGTDGSQYTLNANQWGTNGADHFTMFTLPTRGSWGFCNSVIPTSGWPYANIEKDYNGKQISQFVSLVSTYQVSVPSMTGGQWNVAYDIGINGEVGQGGHEVMIWVYTHNQDTGSPAEGTIRVDNVTYKLSGCRGCRRVDLVLPRNSTSGTVNVLHVLRALQRDSRSSQTVPANAGVYGLQFGSEVHDTAGKNLTFLYQKYTLKP